MANSNDDLLRRKMVCKKSRRKIVRGGKSYVWYVSLEETLFLNVISEDKTLILTIPLDAPKPYAVSKGRVFQGAKRSGCWERYFLPFALPKAITPKTVSEIIDWAERGENAVRTQHGGEVLF